MALSWTAFCYYYFTEVMIGRFTFSQLSSNRPSKDENRLSGHYPKKKILIFASSLLDNGLPFLSYTYK